MADTRDRTVVHYMIRTQHPTRPDCWLLEFLAPAVATALAGCRRWLTRRYPNGVIVGWFCGRPIVRNGLCAKHSPASRAASSSASPTRRARKAASAASKSNTRPTRSATSASSADGAAPGKRS